MRWPPWRVLLRDVFWILCIPPALVNIWQRDLDGTAAWAALAWILASHADEERP